MRIANMEDKKGQKLLINAINNFNLSTTYAQDIFRKKKNDRI